MNLEYNYIISIFLSFIFCLIITFYSVPVVINKMFKADFCGIDVNKLNKPEIPEMGGLGGVIGFSLGITLAVGLIKYQSYIDALPILVSIGVLSIASLIGIMDDVAILGRKEKAWFIAFASLPLIISQISEKGIDFLFFELNITSEVNRLIFWIILVPLGISGCANALNMSAGYNGLESGHLVISSFSLLVISLIKEVDASIIIIFAGIFGTTLSLFWFNKYPSKTFIGDVGTLGFGSLLASTVVMSNLIFYGVLCILPSFFELFSTIKYRYLNVERREACMNPIISDNGNLRVPDGAADYTLAYFILSKKELSERQLVNVILGLYLIAGISAILISLLRI